MTMPPITRIEFMRAMRHCYDRNADVNYEKLWQQWLASQGGSDESR